MTIEDFDSYKKSLPDWAILDGCFGGRIRPTDIDGAVERNGRVLFLEHKSTPTAPLKRAQERLFEALAKTGHAAIVFWSDGDERNVIGFHVYWQGQCEERVPASLESLRAAVAGWYAWAEAQDRHAA